MLRVEPGTLFYKCLNKVTGTVGKRYLLLVEAVVGDGDDYCSEKIFTPRDGHLGSWLLSLIGFWT